MENDTREKLQDALLNAAEQIDISDDPYEAIDLVTHLLEEEFDRELFEEELAMEVRIKD